MRKIHRLTPSIIAKIAAGEVIERPAFAVKELIENAVDADASFIEIQIEESGLRRITVIDNGEGMSREDLEVCFLPHTTSKLDTDKEIIGIRTLGFRGEALSSIAAVSHMTISTRTPKDIGGRIIQVRGGIVEDSAPIGAPIGTSVTAEGLFYSIPARKKFLKSAQTEFRHISDLVSHYALMYPTIQFQLKHNKKSVLDLPAVTEISERIRIILGSALAEHLIPVSHEENHLNIEGFIGKPQVASKQNQKQYIFVNGRAVTDRIVQLAIKEAFGSLLPATQTPVFILHLTLPHEIVDVNVHPRKEKITFVNPDLIFSTVKLAVTKTLNDHNITFHLSKFTDENSAKRGETQSLAGNLLRETVLPWKRTDAITIDPKDTVTQIHQTYLITYDKDNIYLIDQHAAHERILFNTFLEQFSEKQQRTRVLGHPLTISLSLAEKQVLEEYGEIFTDTGISYDIGADNTARITSIPEVFAGRNMERILKDMIADIITGKTGEIRDEGSIRMMKFLACRAAVKAGDVLGEQQMLDLVMNLLSCEQKETCPHGRPTTISLSLEELRHEFRR
jgi:DNA mismatch repair protein MutL